MFVKKLVLVYFSVATLGANAQARTISTACTAGLRSLEGMWSLTNPQVASKSCPQKLEINCEVDPETDYAHLFIDEVRTDGKPGAQIYFSQINGPAISLPDDLTVDEKESSTYNDKKQLLVSSYKKCKLVLGCWGAYKVRHQMRFSSRAENKQALMERMWGENMKCSYAAQGW